MAVAIMIKAHRFLFPLILTNSAQPATKHLFLQPRSVDDLSKLPSGKVVILVTVCVVSLYEDLTGFILPLLAYSNGDFPVRTRWQGVGSQALGTGDQSEISIGCLHAGCEGFQSTSRGHNGA